MCKQVRHLPDIQNNLLILRRPGVIAVWSTHITNLIIKILILIIKSILNIYIYKFWPIDIQIGII